MGGVVITVAGAMSTELRAAFDDLEVLVDHSVTRLVMAGSDPSLLHGVIHRVESLGLVLLGVERDSTT
jgi:hypothetical protein